MSEGSEKRCIVACLLGLKHQKVSEIINKRTLSYGSILIFIVMTLCSADNDGILYLGTSIYNGWYPA